MADQEAEVFPATTSRRFDVLREFHRQARIDKGDGIFIAEAVASRKLGLKPGSQAENACHASEREGQRVRFVGDYAQAEAAIDLDVIERMWKSFYDDVFVPSVENTRNDCEKFGDTRDQIRTDWNPRGAKR